MKLPDEETQRRYDEIARLTREGLSARVITERLGVSPAMVGRARRARGISQPPVPPVSQERLDRARVLLEEGSGYQEAASVIGCCAWTLSQRLPGFALPKADQIERMALGRAMSRLSRSLR